MASRLTSIGITLFWMAMIASLLFQHILPERRRERASLLEPEVLAMQWMDLHDYAWVQHNGRIVGAMMTRIERIQKPGVDPAENQGYRATQTAQVRLNLLGLRRDVRFKMALRLTPSFHVDDFAARIASGGLTIDCTGFVQDNALYFAIAPKGGQAVYRSLALRQPLSLIEAVRPMVARHFDLAVGQEYHTDVVDPVFGMRKGEVILKVAAREVIEHEGEKISAYRLDQTFEGITKSSWVNDRGITIRRELIQGYTLEKSNKPAVRSRYPDVLEDIEIPEIDRQAYIQNARTAPGALPDAPQFNALSLLMGSAAPEGNNAPATSQKDIPDD